MNPKNEKLAHQFVPQTYIQQGMQAMGVRQNLLQTLLSQRKMPDKGWDDATIEYILMELALMDSNNFMDNVGVGEREGRIFSDLVARRHYRMGHGIGRSGDVAAMQPKAAGSSLMAKVTNMMCLDALHCAGLKEGAMSCLLLPLATGISITMTLLTLKQSRPHAKYVVWPRLDQKSCLKAMLTTGLEPIVIPNRVNGDEICTDIVELAETIRRLGPENVLCCVSTASVFAPRTPDNVVEIAKCCKEFGLGHIINNAYGVSCSQTVRHINRACRIGTVTCIVQSTDKNFLVPVGGAIISSPDQEFITKVSRCYPGRASSSQIQDMFITLLSMGRSGYRKILADREALIPYFVEKLGEVARIHGERFLNSGGNRISFAITLNSFCDNTNDPDHDVTLDEVSHQAKQSENTIKATKAVAYLGSMLFMRSISGTRVVTCTDSKQIGPFLFEGYGSHVDYYPHGPYLTAACAIGLTKEEIDTFIEKLDKTMRQYKKKKMIIPKSHEVLSQGFTNPLPDYEVLHQIQKEEQLRSPKSRTEYLGSPGR